MRDFPYYILALLLGLSAGFLEVRLEDLLVTALFVMISTMVLGFLRPRAPWRCGTNRYPYLARNPS